VWTAEPDGAPSKAFERESRPDTSRLTSLGSTIEASGCGAGAQAAIGSSIPGYEFTKLATWTMIMALRGVEDHEQTFECELDRDAANRKTSRTTRA